MIAAALVAVLLVAGGLVFFLTRNTSSGPTIIGPKTVTVDGRVAWTDTRIVLKQGDDVAITASGTVFTNKNFRDVRASPDGVPNQPGLRQFDVVTGGDHGGLIGRISDAGAPFIVGSADRFQADSAGQLFLGINDTGVDDNDGAFVAKVTVTRK